MGETIKFKQGILLKWPYAGGDQCNDTKKGHGNKIAKAIKSWWNFVKLDSTCQEKGDIIRLELK